MQQSTVIAVFLLLVTVAVTSCPTVQAATTIEGVVTGLNGNPVGGAVVRLLTKQREEINTVMTDDKGNFKLTRVADGTFYLTVVKEGFGTYDNTHDFSSGGGDMVEHLEITLYPPAGKLTEAANEFYLQPGKTIAEDAKKSFDRGLKADKDQNFEKALQLFQKAAEQDPSFARAFAHIGIEQQHLGKLDEAKQSLRKAMELNDKDPIPCVKLGGILNSEKNFKDAIPLLEKAVELDPTIVSAQLYLGQTYYNNGQFDKAVGPLSKACSLDPQGNPSAYGVLGNTYVQLKDYRQARVAYKRFLELDPNNPNAEKIKDTVSKLDQTLNAKTK